MIAIVQGRVALIANHTGTQALFCGSLSLYQHKAGSPTGRHSKNSQCTIAWILAWLASWACTVSLGCDPCPWLLLRRCLHFVLNCNFLEMLSSRLTSLAVVPANSFLIICKMDVSKQSPKSVASEKVGESWTRQYPVWAPNIIELANFIYGGSK